VAGLLTSLPVFCLGIGAAVVAGVARRFGLNRVMTLSLLLLTVFVAARPFTGAAGMLIATAGIGLAITAGNVLLPVVVRRDFPADRKSTRLNSSHVSISYAVLCLKNKTLRRHPPDGQ